MQLIEAALAFAITMLALSLVVSSFVEIIHRIFSMREAGLKYVLGQMFDQVIAKYVVDAILLKARDEELAAAARNERMKGLSCRRAHELCRAHERQPRADGGAPKATPTTQTGKSIARGAWSIV